MSVKVDLDRLAQALTGYTFAYLVTVGDDYRAKTVAVSPVLDDGVLDVGPVGAGTRGNLTGHDNVTLLWPPREPGGYTLIIDGRALASDDDDDPLRIAPTHAVLHRPAPPNSRPSATGCGDDCLPVG